MTKGERRSLLGIALVLSLVCCALFARAVLAKRADDLARAQARAALLPTLKSPSSDGPGRSMLEWTGAIDQTRFWQALQRFRVISQQVETALQYTVVPLTLISRLDAAEAALRTAVTQQHARGRRSRLENMLGLAYAYNARLHHGQEPIEPQLDGKAIVAFRRAVSLDGSDDDAKTNLELLLRQQQRRERKRQKEQPKLAPAQARSQNLMPSATGIPGQNGSVGRHFSGGY